MIEFVSNFVKQIATREDFWVWTVCAWLDTVFHQSHSVIFEPSESDIGYLYKPARVMRFIAKNKCKHCF